jgi:hypothetical protein
VTLLVLETMPCKQEHSLRVFCFRLHGDNKLHKHLNSGMETVRWHTIKNMAAVRNIEIMSNESNVEKKTLSWIWTSHGGGNTTFDLMGWRCIVPKGRDVSKEHIVSIFRSKGAAAAEGRKFSQLCYFLTWLIIRPSRLRWCILPKRRAPFKMHGFTTQQMVLLKTVTFSK